MALAQESSHEPESPCHADDWDLGSEEERWATGVWWVKNNFRSICRYVGKFRPVPYVVEHRDLRQTAYMVAFVTLQEGHRNRSIHEFVGRFFKKLSWEIMATYPPVFTEPNIDVETLAQVESIRWLPGFSWPTRIIDSRVREKALAAMSERQRRVWVAYLTGDMPDGTASRRRFYQGLSDGIESVLTKIGRGDGERG